MHGRTENSPRVRPGADIFTAYHWRGAVVGSHGMPWLTVESAL